MAKRSDYFGLGYIVSLILAIIPVTSWILGAVTFVPFLFFVLILVVNWFLF